MRTTICEFAMIAALAAPAYAAPPLDESGIDVTVEQRGAMIVVDVRMPIDATAREAWDVLTDYEHMAAFVSNLKSSAILRRTGNTLEVEQMGEAKRGLITFPFETVRLVELVPHSEIRSSLIRGKFKSYLFTTRIVDEGAKAVVVNHGEYEPTMWVPPVLGPAMIEAETRTQYAEIRREILRRKRVATATP
jgi:hypothetical protein